MIEFDKEICTDFNKSSKLEWLETNGIGGFASSTISGANTRRYHGILTAAMRPPLGRVTILSKFEETLVIDDARFELSANQYPNKIYPEGFKYLKNFRLKPFPIWTFEIGNVRIEKKVFMIHGENTTVCRWSMEGENRELQLELKPLFSFVDYHALQHETEDFSLKIENFENTVKVIPNDDLTELFFNHNADELEKTGVWYRNFEYEIEKERGFDFHEDLFQPFILKFDLSETANVLISTEKHEVEDTKNFETAEIRRAKN